MAESRFSLSDTLARLRLDEAAQSVQSARRALTPGRVRDALRLREGWLTVALAALMVLVVQFAILRANWAAQLNAILPGVTFGGLLLGFVLAKLPLRNWQAHLVGVPLTLALVWYQTLNVIDGRFGNGWGKSAELLRRLSNYARAAWVEGNPEDDLFLFVLVLALMMAFAAYWTMWWTLRSHWISPVLATSGLILLVNLGYDKQDARAFLALFLLVAIPFTIRFNAARQEWAWNAAHITYPASLNWRFMSVATGVTLALLFVSYSVPFSVHQGPITDAWNSNTGPWQDFENAINRFFPSVEGRGRTRNTFPGFAAFGESFQLGSGLNLPEDPAVALKCEGGIYAQYVKMNTYDTYTGRGFKKTPADVTKQQADGNLYDPRVDQAADKPVPLPATANQAARQNVCTADLFRPRGNLLPITGTQLEQVNTDVRVSLGWQVFTPNGVNVPPNPGEVVPPALAELVKQAGAVSNLTIPTEPPPLLRPGAPPQVILQRDGTLVIYIPQGNALDLAPAEFAALVTRAQQQVQMQATGQATLQAGGQAGTPTAARVPNIARVVVVEAPVTQPTPTVAPVPTGSAVAGTATPAPTATVAPTATAIPAPVMLDRRLDPIAQEQTRLAQSLVQTQIVMQGGKITQILYRGQAPNYGDIEQIVSKGPVPVGKQVSETARVSEATESDLRGAASFPPTLPRWSARYLQLPDGVTQRTADLAETLGRGKMSSYDYALAVEQYLRDTITYTEKVSLPPYDRDVTDYFLFQSKAGYGEYYSTAMTVLLRLGGVPAREVVGYLPGGKSEDGRFVSRENQAHAWVEVWFPRYGWVTFDPTPKPGAVALVRGVQPVEKPATPETNEGDLAGGQDRLDARGEDDLRRLDEELAGANYPDDGSFVGGVYTPKREVNPLFFVIPGLLGTIALLLTLFWLAGLRGLVGYGRWYGRMTRAARLTGLVKPSATTTPLEMATAVGHRLPATREAATRMAERYAAERYAGDTPDSDAMLKGREAWHTMRGQFLRGLLPRNRSAAASSVPETPVIRPRGRRGK